MSLMLNPEFALDMVYIKYTNLRLPVAIPLIELFPAVLSKEDFANGKIVLISNKKESDTAPEERTNFETKEAFTALLDQLLRDPKVEFGVVQDFVIQPERNEMTVEVKEFLDKYK